MKPTLLVLAAGMGSRYGGLKQIDPVGPGGATIIDYSVYDAIRAGFEKLVFVIRKDIAEPFRQTIGARFEERLPVEYVYQELDRLPPGWTAPPERKKPWGTGQAILLAAEVIREPFAVINGDDFYGANSFRSLADHLNAGRPGYAMVGFKLNNTLSDFGSVCRGVCRVTGDGYLEGLAEVSQIERDGRAAKYTDINGSAHPLTGLEIASMNMWGFTPTLFADLKEEWLRFLNEQGQDPRAEFYIPAVVNTLVSQNRGSVRVLSTPDSWLGVTYREDRPLVTAGIRKLIAQGAYPQQLWA